MLLKTPLAPTRASRYSTQFRRRPTSIRTRVSSPNQPEVGSVFPGKYGFWELTADDVKEVMAYRATLNIAALSALLIALPFPRDPVVEDVLVLVGAASMGASLQLIHIYMSVVKRTLQAMFGFGFFAACALGTNALSSEDGAQSIVQFVQQSPWSMWLVGPAFAAVTGLAFKEGLCYDKPYPKVLCALTPIFCLAHLASQYVDVPESLVSGLGYTWTASALVFAASKWSQPSTDDLGDKSIFDFLALSEEEQAAKLRQLQGDFGFGLGGDAREPESD